MLAEEGFNILLFPIRKVPMDTCGKMHRWKRSTNMMCSVDRLKNIKSHRTNKVNSGNLGFG